MPWRGEVNRSYGGQQIKLGAPAASPSRGGGVKSRPRDAVLHKSSSAAAPDYAARAEQSIRRQTSASSGPDLSWIVLVRALLTGTEGTECPFCLQRYRLTHLLANNTGSDCCQQHLRALIRAATVNLGHSAERVYLLEAREEAGTGPPEPPTGPRDPAKFPSQHTPGSKPACVFTSKPTICGCNLR